MTAPVSYRETGIRLTVRRVTDVCDFVDQLDRKAVGELVIRGADGVREARGVVLVESGRICWAAARGLARRLTALLVARSPGMDEGRMESLFRQCRSENVPLGEFLVARGIVAPGDLRTALLQHTMESLDALCATGAQAEWCLRRGAGYNPRFTFSTSELLVGASTDQMSLEEQAIRAVAEATLSTRFATGEWGAAFVRGNSAVPKPVAVHGELPETTTIFLRVGQWAASALDLASTFQDEDAMVSTVDDARDAVLVAWRCGDPRGNGAFIAGRTTSRGPARILNLRARERRTRLASGEVRRPSGVVEVEAHGDPPATEARGKR